MQRRLELPTPTVAQPVVRVLVIVEQPRDVRPPGFGRERTSVYFSVPLAFTVQRDTLRWRFEEAFQSSATLAERISVLRRRVRLGHAHAKGFQFYKPNHDNRKYRALGSCPFNDSSAPRPRVQFSQFKLC